MSEERRRAILEAAAKDAELVEQIPAVVAAGFGVLALRRLGDVLTVACFPRANRQALRLLRDVLEVEIVATPFEDPLLHEAIRSAYFPNDESVNFPTFLDAGFLEDPASALALQREKVEVPGQCSLELAADQVVLASLTYGSVLRNTDARFGGQGLPDPNRTRLDLGTLETGWRLEDGRPHIYVNSGRLAETVSLLLTQFRLTEYRHMHGGGQVSEHHVLTNFLGEPPLIIHPTEVQLTEIAADGTLTFHVYDRPERFPPGGEGRICLDYHFLSYGNRMHREIEIDLHEILLCPRDMLVVHQGEAPWSSVELARWFGLKDNPSP